MVDQMDMVNCVVLQLPDTEYVLSLWHQPQTETGPVGDRWLGVHFSSSTSSVKLF